MEKPEKDPQSRQAGVMETNGGNRECCDRQNGTLNPLLLTSITGFVSVRVLPRSNLLRAGILRISD